MLLTYHHLWSSTSNHNNIVNMTSYFKYFDISNLLDDESCKIHPHFFFEKIDKPHLLSNN